MYSNNIVHFQESTTILNIHTKKVWKLIEFTTYIYACMEKYEAKEGKKKLDKYKRWDKEKLGKYKVKIKEKLGRDRMLGKEKCSKDSMLFNFA